MHLVYVLQACTGVFVSLWFCTGAAEATRGCEGKPIKKCHQAPLSLSQRLQLESPTTKKKNLVHCPLNPSSSSHTHTHTPCYNSLPQTTLSLEEANEPTPFSWNEEGWKWGARVPSWLLTSSENDLVCFFLLCPTVSSRCCSLQNNSTTDECVNRWVLSPCETLCLCVLQCHSPRISGWAAQELCGHAGADAGRKGLFGDWLPAGEGMVEPP